ncbi:transposase [Streptomyces sp. NBC_01481]|uniref:transposase n=1 Tax=Streptomyces sp. NBC_01481 TaxID=2975869 RepID=UPI002251AC06|nr:transposase [Streptomyces sp. NBC_01481]MCX4586316.1 transposase [Streptomyces sp. NBC_01481]
MRRADLTNDQWARLEPLPPQGIKSGRPPVWARRQLIDGIRWRTRTGATWRDVSERLGRDRVNDFFRRCRRDSTWARIVAQLLAQADAKGLITWDVNPVDTIFVHTLDRLGRNLREVLTLVHDLSDWQIGCARWPTRCRSTPPTRAWAASPSCCWLCSPRRSAPSAPNVPPTPAPGSMATASALAAHRNHVATQLR